MQIPTVIFHSIYMVTVNYVKAFSETVEGGNPAGVVLDADSLTEDQMQNIAFEVGFSETAFVQKSKVADYKVKFFSPKQEVDFCGHATVATFHLLSEINSDATFFTQETNIGVLPVDIKNKKIMMTQPGPQFLEKYQPDLACEILNIEPNLLADTPVQSVSTAMSKLIVPLKPGTVEFIEPDLSKIEKFTTNNPVNGVGVFESVSDSNLLVRYFNPEIGVEEDAATGVFAGPLAWYVKKYNQIQQQENSFKINQGFNLGMPSEIFVETSTDKSKTYVGGYAVKFSENSFEV